MVDIKYANAYSEVLEILKYIPIEDYNKIPKSKIEVFEHNRNREYKFVYNPDKTLNEQNVSEGGKAIIGLLYRDYWASDTQKEKIIAKQNYYRQKIEEQKRKKYKPDDIFKNKQNNFNIQRLEKQEERLELVEYKEFKWYKKILSKIMKVLRKN